MTPQRGTPFEATVLRREVLGPHLVRLVLAGPGLSAFSSTGVPDEWVALTVPGQFQTRYYTVRSDTGDELILDVVMHDHGLVTEWAQGPCVGQTVGISTPKGSYTEPDDAGWVLLVGDLTALPAVARITETTSLPVTAYVESGDGEITDYLDAPVTWLDPPSGGESGLAELVRTLVWPEGPGYFWMAGESAQMRDIRRHVRHELGFAPTSYDVMGYWSGSRGRRIRAQDPGPVYARGKNAGLSDEQIWDEYDAARAPR